MDWFDSLVDAKTGYNLVACNTTMVAALLNVKCVLAHILQRANQMREYFSLADGTSATLPRMKSRFNTHYPCIRVGQGDYKIIAAT